MAKKTKSKNTEPKTDVLQKLINNKLLKRASDVNTLNKITSNCVSLDYALGGGIPEGRMILFTGKKSVCKSTISYSIAGQYLKKYPDRSVFIIDFENSFESNWVANFIKDTKSVFVSTPSTSNQAVDEICDLIRSGVVGLFIIDSIAESTSEQELTKGGEGYTMGSSALVWNKGFKLIKSALNYQARELEEESTLIFLNQERLSFSNNPAIPPSITNPGGFGQYQACSIHIRFVANDTYFENISNDVELTDSSITTKNDDTKEPIGVNIKYQVKKNKTAPTQDFTGNFDFIFSKHSSRKFGFDNWHGLIFLSRLRGVLIMRGAYYFYKEENIGQGINKTIENLKNNKELLDNILKELNLENSYAF